MQLIIESGCAARQACEVMVPEEDVPGLVAVGVNQLLLQLLQGAVVDVDWTL